MAERIEVDTCVVGAGYAGLTAARRLTQAGTTVAVLEARDRIGGRIWTQPLSDGSPVDRGGAWLGPDHDAIFALAREVDVSTYKTWVHGAHLLVDHGRIRRYTGLIPKISPLAIVTIALAQLRIDRMAKGLPVDAPWTAKHALEWDSRSVADWIAHCRVRTGIAHDLFEMAVRGLMTGDLNEVSLLHLLALVRGHGSINTLFSIEGGAQENMVEGGAGEIARRVAAALGDAVHLDSPVTSITDTRDRVVVQSERVVVSARHVIVALPPALTLEIDFDPALPADRIALYRNSVAGPESKTLVVYDEPFWRGEGFSGQTSEPDSVAEVTLDATPAAGRPGVVAVFAFSHVAERVDAMHDSDRRQALLDALAARLGPRAARPAEVIETPWWKEVWTRGCSMAHLTPGTLTRHGHLIREPFGRVHWAGTETATISHGAIDGAVRSGERAAAEILNRL